MSRTFHHGQSDKQERRIRVRGILREQPDYRKLARALIALALAEAEADAEAEAERQKSEDGKQGDTTTPSVEETQENEGTT
jgi:hypothetical protein